MSGLDLTPVEEKKTTGGMGLDLTPAQKKEEVVPAPKTTQSGPLVIPFQKGAFDIPLSANTPVATKDPARAAAMQSLKKLSPDGAAAEQRLNFAVQAAPIIGISAQFAYKEAETVAKALYGPYENPGSAGTKLNAAIKDAPINEQLGTLWAQQMRDGETPEVQDQIADLEKKRISNGKDVWSFLVNSTNGLFVQAKALLQASVPPPIGGGQEALNAYYQRQLEASDKYVGSMAGEFYGSLRRSGVSPEGAKSAAGVMIAAQEALNALSVSKVPGVAQGVEALAEASAKAIASGQLAKAVGIQVGKGYAEQGAVAIINNGVSVIIPELAISLDKRVKSGKITWDDAVAVMGQFVKDIPQMAKDAAPGVLMQTLVMGTVSAIPGAAMTGSEFSKRATILAGEVAKAPKPLPSEAGGVVPASDASKATITPSAPKTPEFEALKAEEATYKKALDEAPISDILGNGEIVPRGTPEPTGAKLAKLEHPDNAAVFEAVNKTQGTTDDVHKTGYVFPDGTMPDMSGGHPSARMVAHSEIEGHPELTGTAARDDLVARGAVRIDVPPMDEIHRGQPAVVELGEMPTSAQMSAIREALDSGREVQIEMHGRGEDGFAGYDAEDSKHAMQAIRSYYEQEAPAKAPEGAAALTDEQFAANYPKAVEARAALEAAMDDPAQAGKVAGLAEALASAKKEANMMAAERGRVRVQNERARVERRDSVNKMIKDINELDTSKIPNEYKKPIADLMDQFTTDNPTNKTLEGLVLIKQDIENGVNPAEFTKKQLARMGELSKKNLRDLTPDELTAVHDAIMGYFHSGRRQVALQVKGRDIYFNGLEEADPKAFKAGLEEYQASHPDLSPEEAYAQFSKENRGAIDIIAEEIDTAHPDTSLPKYGTKTPFERGKESIKKLVEWGKASNLGYETMGSVLAKGEDSLLYKVVVKPIDEGETVYSDKKHEYSMPFTEAAKDQKIGTYDWHHAKVKVDIPGLPAELERADILALAGIKASGGNLGESGFVLKKDWTPGKVYKLTDNELEALFSKLDDGDKAYLDLMYAQGKKGGQDRADVFKRVNGYDMPLEDIYYPFYRIVDDSGILTEEQIISQRNRRSAMPDQSHNIEREESSKPFFIRGIDEDLIDIIDDTARYVGMTEPARNAARVLMNPEVKKSIVQAGGEDFHREMMDGLKAASGNKPVTNTLDRWALKMRNKGIGAVVGFNMKMAFMNRVLNFRSTAAYVPGRDWAVGVSQSIAHPFQVNKVLMENSALYRDIHDLGSWSELTDVLSDQSRGVAAKIRNVGAKPMKLGVAAQTRDDMWAAVTQAKREMKEGKASKDVQRALGLEDENFPPMTAEEQLAGQVKYAEYVAKRIHASPREIYKGNLTREGIMGTLTSTMMSDRNAVLQTGIRLAQDIHTPGGGKRMAKYLLVGVFGEAMAYTAISGTIVEAGKEITASLAGTKAKKQTEKEKTVAAISQLIDGIAGNVYGAGDVGYIARKLMTEGNTQINTGQSLVSQFSGDMVDTLTYMKTALSTKNRHIEERAWANAFDSFLSWSLPMTVGVPYKYGIGSAMGVYKESLK